MSTGTLIDPTVTCDLFDGSQTQIDALIAAHPTTISEAIKETTYPAQAGDAVLTPGTTGVTGGFVTVKGENLQTATVTTLTVTNQCTASGNVTVKLFQLADKAVALLDTDDTQTKVATKIRSASYAGWTTSGSGAIVIFTQNASAQKNGVVNVLTNGHFLDAYKDTYIAWFAAETMVIGKTEFEAKYTVA